jgi:MoxR-like ATPase
MFSLDLALRRFFRAVRNALPGATTASRLAQKDGNWRQQPPAQRASAYAQFLHTQQQLRQMHVGQKIAPKIVDLLFAALRGFIKSPLGELLLILMLAWLITRW